MNGALGTHGYFIHGRPVPYCFWTENVREAFVCTFCPLFYTSILLIFNNLQVNVRIRDFFTLIIHLAPEEESGLLSLRKDIETPNKHTKRWNKEKRVVINYNRISIFERWLLNHCKELILVKSPKRQ